MNRKLTIASVQPHHPPQRHSAASMGMGTREDGVVSSVRIYIDLGLKTNQLGEVDMTIEDAEEFAEKFIVAIGNARRANRRG